MSKPAAEDTPLIGTSSPYQGEDVERQNDAAFEEVEDVEQAGRIPRSRLLLTAMGVLALTAVVGFQRGLSAGTADIARGLDGDNSTVPLLPITGGLRVGSPASTSSSFFNSWSQPATIEKNFTEVHWIPANVSNVTLTVNEGNSETVEEALARIKNAETTLMQQMASLKREKTELEPEYMGEYRMQIAALEARMEEMLEEQEEALQETYEKEWQSKYEQIIAEIKALMAKKQMLDAKEQELLANQQDLAFHHTYFNQLENNAGDIAAQGSQLQNNEYGDLDQIEEATPGLDLPSSKYLNKFSYHHLMNSPGGNYAHVQGNMDDIAAECIQNPTCAGFNSNGLLKNKLLSKPQWTISSPNGNANQGLFTKNMF